MKCKRVLNACVHNWQGIECRNRDNIWTWIHFFGCCFFWWLSLVFRGPFFVRKHKQNFSSAFFDYSVFLLCRASNAECLLVNFESDQLEMALATGEDRRHHFHRCNHTHTQPSAASLARFSDCRAQQWFVLNNILSFEQSEHVLDYFR